MRGFQQRETARRRARPFTGNGPDGPCERASLRSRRAICDGVALGALCRSLCGLAKWSGWLGWSVRGGRRRWRRVSAPGGTEGGARRVGGASGSLPMSGGSIAAGWAVLSGDRRGPGIGPKLSVTETLRATALDGMSSAACSPAGRAGKIWRESDSGRVSAVPSRTSSSTG